MTTKKIAPVYLDGKIYNSTTTNPSKHYRCKSRKRYIKLLMGEGVERNFAEAFADIIRAFDDSYQRAWMLRCLNRENSGRYFF